MRLIVLSLLAVGACTDAELFQVTDPTRFEQRQSITAEVCAPPDLLERVPYKVLFVIDTSESNDDTDPRQPGGMTRREDAVIKTISAHKNEPNVSFGVITFADQPRRQTFGFIRDIPVLLGAVENVSQAQGRTNYSDTLWVVTDFIKSDLAVLSSAEALRTQYIVFWLSDGAPTLGVTDPAAILPGVTYLADSLAEESGGLRFNTAFLGGAPASTPEQVDQARGLLQSMAMEGTGTFVDIKAGDSFAFSIDTEPRVRKYQLVDAYATNWQMLFRRPLPHTDSDGDGVTDADETRLNIDARVADTDGDGVRDGVEVMLAPQYDPNATDTPCGEINSGDDPDADGLNNCEENLLGTDPNVGDSDGDRLLDGFEVQLRAAALINDPAADVDADGLTDGFEVRAHLDPREPNSLEERDTWGYRYAATLLANAEDAPFCYQIRAENIFAFETLATDTHLKGTNVLELVAVFEPANVAQATRFLRASTEVRFLLPDIEDPPSGTVRLRPVDFSGLPFE